MAIKAIDLSETIDYISELDRENPKTIWKLGVLDSRIRAKIEDIAWEYEADPSKPDSARAKATFNINKSEMDFVAFGIKGFEDFVKSDGKKVYYKTQERVVNNKTYHVLADDVIAIIPRNVIRELAGKIKDLNNISEEERKN